MTEYYYDLVGAIIRSALEDYIADEEKVKRIERYLEQERRKIKREKKKGIDNKHPKYYYYNKRLDYHKTAEAFLFGWGKRDEIDLQKLLYKTGLEKADEYTQFIRRTAKGEIKNKTFSVTLSTNRVFDREYIHA